MGLLDRVNARAEGRSSIDTWLSDYLMPAQFGFNGHQYGVPQINQTYAQGKLQEIARTLPGYMAAARNCPPVFGAQLVRSLVLSQARFTFRNPPWHSKSPRKVFGTTALGLLERPWKNATTGELVSRMEWHAGLAGNAYVYKQPDRLRVLRPDWVAILYGSDLEPEDPMHAIDGELLGYVYANGGIGVGTPRTLLPDEVAHWSPIPDPESAGIGMSWVTPAVRDIQGDIAATDHKLQFFKNGATPNLVVKGLPNTSPQAYWDAVEALEQSHTGVRNAYRTLYLTAGADATVVGSDMKQIDFKATQGSGETRISLLSRVPATILGISEGLAGSSLNAGNFGMARRIFADSWVYPNLQDLAAALAPLVRVPNDAELWFDTTDIPLLREDAKDAADIAAVKSQAIRTLTDGGYDPTSTVATIAPDWATTLQHTGKLSVQLQEPGAQPAEAPPPKEKADPAPRSGQLNQGARQFNPGQKRDPDGKFGDGIPGPSAAGSFTRRLSRAAQGEDALAAATFGLDRTDRPDDFTPEMARAVNTYTGAEYNAVNRHLRNQTMPYGYTSADVKPLVNDVDRAMKLSSLSRETVTYRGVGNARGMFGDHLDNDLTGLEWREEAYVSTSARENKAQGFAGRNEDSVVMRVLAPAGTPAVEGSGMDLEAEVVFGRGLRMRIVADRGFDPDGRRQVDVEVLGG